MKNLTQREKEAARKAKNAYQKEWSKRNKEKVKEYQQNFWLKKAKQEGLI